MKNIYDLGVDIKSDWSFKDGDVILTSYDENMGQAVVNRLKCLLGAMSLFYVDYGSDIIKYLGELNKQSTWEYIRIEIESRVIKDPRVSEVSCLVQCLNTHVVEVHLDLLFYDGSTSQENLVINGDGTVELS